MFAYGRKNRHDRTLLTAILGWWTLKERNTTPGRPGICGSRVLECIRARCQRQPLPMNERFESICTQLGANTSFEHRLGTKPNILKILESIMRGIPGCPIIAFGAGTTSCYFQAIPTTRSRRERHEHSSLQPCRLLSDRRGR
jgi:hypothetical protein